MVHRSSTIFVAVLLFFASVIYGQSAKDLIEDGRQKFIMGNYQEAIKLLNQSLEIELRGDAYYGLGLCYMKTEAYDEAYEVFQNAVNLDPSFVDAYYLLAGIYRKTSSTHYDKKKAIEILKKALEIRADHAYANYWIGVLYSTLGSSYDGMIENDELAQIYLKRALELDPNIADAYLYLGQIYANRDSDFNSSIAYYKKATELNPSHYEAWYYLGFDYTRVGSYDEAISALETAQKSSSSSIRSQAVSMLKAAYKSRGEKRRRAGENNMAIQDFHKLLDLEPGNGEIHALLSVCYYLEKDYPQAILYIEKSYQLAALNEKIYLHSMGMAYAKSGNLKEAKALFEKLQSLMPAGGLVYRDWAAYYALQNKSKEAVSNLKKAIELGYDNLKWLKTDDSLDNIRGEKKYKDLIKMLEERQAQQILKQ